MSETVVKKQQRKAAGGKTPREYAEECDHVQQQLRADFQRREAERQARDTSGEK